MENFQITHEEQHKNKTSLPLEKTVSNNATKYILSNDNIKTTTTTKTVDKERKKERTRFQLDFE